MSDKKPALQSNDVWIKFMKICSISGCHQRYDRSFVFKNYQFPLCARCTGLFLGYLAGFTLSFIFYRFNALQAGIFYFLAAAVLSASLLAIDGFGQLKGKWESNNRRRFITGLLCGTGMVCFAVKGIVLLLTIFFRH